MKIINSENILQLIINLINSKKDNFFIEYNENNYEECKLLIGKKIKELEIIDHFCFTNHIEKKYIWIRKGLNKNIIICFLTKKKVNKICIK